MNEQTIPMYNRKQMKMATYRTYGSPDVITIVEQPMPIPAKNEVLIKISASTVSSADSRMRSFTINPLMWIPMRLFLGVLGPRKKILGFSFSGVVEAVGKDVTYWQKGDEVFGSSGMKGGAHAEYLSLAQTAEMVKKPEEMSHKEAASIPFGGTTALFFLEKAQVSYGDHVLIYGASGAIGTAAVQIAKAFGAQVTGVCSGQNAALVKSLGANHIIDYTKGNVVPKPDTFDIIFDTVGKSPFRACITSLKKKGKYVRAVHMELTPLLKGLLINCFTQKRVLGGISIDKSKDFLYLARLYSRNMFKPIIDRIYSLDDIKKAHQYVDQGHKKGNVIIDMTYGR